MNEERYEKNYYEHQGECQACNRQCCCRPKKGPEPGRALLKCGCGCGTPLPKVDATLIGNVKPIPVASVTLDASALKDPTILLTFTSEIYNAGLKLFLNFLIKKNVKGGCCEYICGTHSFKTEETTKEIESFSFQICDDSPCDECVTYVIEVVPMDAITDLGASINNAHLSALAVENQCH